MLYPEFSMRVYHDMSWNDKDEDSQQQMEELCQIACEYESVDLCSAYELGSTFFSATSIGSSVCNILILLHLHRFS